MKLSPFKYLRGRPLNVMPAHVINHMLVTATMAVFIKAQENAHTS
jgi:hypothetical protein